ncbi:hypothetical protein [Kineococcus rhizosphaerae]|uniref:hypothetical protein n=1 Tax=Kineococcus rhizosphaerae TaxID=559628 RepID=UPI0014765DED|nr:hypothetical protein [Kineococcus rhizosphaerae]
MTDPTVTIVVSRVLRDRGWTEHRDQVSADLHAQAVAKAGRDGLTLIDIGDVVVHVGADALWARLTRTATARPRHLEDDGAARGPGSRGQLG